MLLLALLSTLAQTPQHALFRQPNSLRGGMAAFEALNGAGTFGACSTTPPVGFAYGAPVALVFARASSAMCTKTAGGGHVLANIQNGDLVLLATDQPRVMNDWSGKLKLAADPSYTQSALRTEDFSNAYWTGPYGCTGSPALIANAGTAPDGTRTAERFYITGTTTTGRCIMYATIAGGTGKLPSAYVRGCIPESDAGCAEGIVSSGDGGVLFSDGGVARQPDGGVGSGVVDVGMEGTAALNACGCAYNATGWSRCAGNTGTNSGTFFVGNDGLAGACGSGTRGPQDVMFWGANATNTTSLLAYAASISGATAVAAESPYFPLPDGLAFGCLGLTFTTPAVGVSGARQLALARVDANNFWEPYIGSSGSAASAFTYVGAVSDTVNVTGNITPNTNVRFSQYRTTTPTLCGEKDYVSACDATGVGATITTSGGGGRLYLGADSTSGFELRALIGEVVLDSTASRCR